MWPASKFFLPNYSFKCYINRLHKVSFWRKKSLNQLSGHIVYTHVPFTKAQHVTIITLFIINYKMFDFFDPKSDHSFYLKKIIVKPKSFLKNFY